MKYRVHHLTTYTYTDVVPVCQNLVHLTPRSSTHQRCIAHRLAIRPRPHTLDRRFDYYGNAVHQFSVVEGHQKLIISARSRVILAPRNLPAPDATLPWEQVREQLSHDLSPAGLEARQFIHDSPHVPRLTDLAHYAATSFPAGKPILAGGLDLMRRLHREMEYDPAATTVSTPIDEVFKAKRGVCQDYSHLMLGCFRSLGLSARYVSGYLRTVAAPGKERLVGADASHAWVSLYCGPAGWIDLDPTNNLAPNLEHITVAWGRDFYDVSPISGMFIGGGQNSLHVAVTVEPVGA